MFVRPAVLRGKNVNVGHCAQPFQPRFLDLLCLKAPLTSTIDLLCLKAPLTSTIDLLCLKASLTSTIELLCLKTPLTSTILYHFH